MTLRERMWETLTEKAIGGLLSPWQIRREGKAQAEVRSLELLMLAQAETDALEIRHGRKRLEPSGQIQEIPAVLSGARPPAEETESAARHLKLLARVAADASIGDAMRREINVAGAILHAETELGEQTTEPPAAKPEADWLFRWRDAASEVSAEELRHLWGQVLAGEVRKPGTFSLRTLEFLRNVSKEEAASIAVVAPYVIGGAIFKVGLPPSPNDGVSFIQWLDLHDLGLLSEPQALLTTTIGSSRSDRFEGALRSGTRVLLITHPDPVKTLELGAHKVTRFGQEVFSLSSPLPDESYLRRIGARIKSEGFQVTLGNHAVVAGSSRLVDGQVL